MRVEMQERFRRGFSMPLPPLEQADILPIAKALADTDFGFTGTELALLIPQCRFVDTDPTITKHKRLYNAFVEHIMREQSTKCIYTFIQEVLKPARGLNDFANHEKRRLKVNEVLMLHGVEINEKGQFIAISKAETVSEVQRRTKNLQQRLYGYSAHSYVLKCCRAELLQENYFHAVLEAAKSLLDRIRDMTGLIEDGTALVDKALSVKNPMIAMNSLRTESERNQQNGLREMINGVIHMVRNVTAHELKIRWDINEKDAVEILALISTLHKYLDSCVKVPTTHI